jgi:Protein of unknown function (DUF998)
MLAGFAVFGVSMIGFGAALRACLGGARQAGPGPWLLQLAGVLTLGAAFFRRDHMLLTSGPESWHNQAHNVVSALLYILLVAAPVMLASRLRAEPRPRWAPGSLAAAGAIAAVILVLFVSGAARPWDGTLQRLGVSIPLAALVALAASTAREVLSLNRGHYRTEVR